MSKGYGIFNFSRPYKNDEHEAVLLQYDNACLDEMTGTVHLEGIKVLEKKYGDFIDFKENFWCYKGINDFTNGVYEVHYKSFEQNTCFGIQDEESARLIFEVYEI